MDLEQFEALLESLTGSHVCVFPVVCCFAHTDLRLGLVNAVEHTLVELQVICTNSLSDIKIPKNDTEDNTSTTTPLCVCVCVCVCARAHMF